MDLIKHSKSPALGSAGVEGHWQTGFGWSWGCGLRRSGGQRAPLSSLPECAGGLAGVREGAGLAASVGSPFQGEVAQPEVPRSSRWQGGRCAWAGGGQREGPGGARGRDGTFPPVASTCEHGVGWGLLERAEPESFACQSVTRKALLCIYGRGI